MGYSIHEVQLNREHFDREVRELQRPVHYLLFLNFVHSSAMPLDAYFHDHKVDSKCLEVAKTNKQSAIFYRYEIPPEATYFDREGRYDVFKPDCTLALKDNEHGFVLKGKFNNNGEKFADLTLRPMEGQTEALLHRTKRVFPVQVD